MTHFFALPDETEAWLSELTGRLDLVRLDRPLHANGLQAFLWPRADLDLRPTHTFGGVMVMFPQVWPESLVMGDTGWKASAFHESTAAVGRRLNGQVTRSLRTWVTTPLYGVSRDGAHRTPKPFAWGSAAAVERDGALLQFRNGLVTFVP